MLFLVRWRTLGSPLLGISGARIPEQHGRVREGLAMGKDSAGCHFLRGY